MRLKFINLIASNELREALRELEGARCVVMEATSILSQIDQMRSQEEATTIESQIGYNVHNVDNTYYDARYLDRLTPKIRSCVPGLELLFYETDTQERRIHLFHDLMFHYLFFTDLGNQLAYAIPFDLVYDTTKDYRKARVAAIRDFISRNNLPECCLYRVNYVSRGYIMLDRTTEIPDVLDLNKQDYPQVDVFNIISRALEIGRDFVAEVEYLALIYGVDLESLRSKEEKLRSKMVAKEQERIETKPYKLMPRSHRIAALYTLLGRAGINTSNTDKTRMASFIEAVTGGNIEADAEKTYSYTTPNRSAYKGAAPYLELIGITPSEK
jgi:hypothetical protein|nr:MAG TPA: hypothetical protein [Caudoviricetes sp.]